jgi:serine/threonine protein kinase/tetratricopeptide (TPR) repeat protein
MSSPTEIVEEPELPRTLGPYLLLEVVGKGGMGLVYRALNSSGDNVAVKVIRRDLVEEPEIRKRFAREARAVAQLVHPNIARLLDFGIDQGETYMVMEYVGGGSMVPWRLNPPDGQTLHNTMVGILRALAHAHAKGIVHRDLKPENVLLHYGDDGIPVPKVMDFGVAHFRDDTPGEQTGASFVGTPEYMSPEQILNPADVSPASDLYAVGIMLFESVCGRLPFSRSSAEATVIAHVNAPVPPVVARPGYQVLGGLEQVIERLLMKLPQTRYMFAADARRALEKCAIVGEPSMALKGAVRPAAPSDRTNLSTVRSQKSRSGRTTTNPEPHPLGLLGLREPHFTGRESELRRMATVAAAALSSSSTRLICVIGEAGTGKTRLVSQLAETIEESGTMQVWSARVERDSPDALSPLRTSFRRGLRLTGLTEPECEKRIGEMLRRQCVSDVWEETALLQLFGPHENPSGLLQQESARFALLERVLRRASQDRPVLLRFEDVHHDDGTVLRFIDWILSSRAGRFPGCVVVTGRPNLLAHASHETRTVLTRILNDISSVGTLVKLEPLSDEEIGQMLSAHLTILSVPTPELVRRAQGNPQLALELMRYIMDASAEDGSLMESDPGALLPQALGPILQKRLSEAAASGGDTAETSLIWELLAVAGNTVSVSLAAELVREAGIADEMRALDRALTAGMLTGILREPELGRYAFETDWLREALLEQAETTGRIAVLNRHVARARIGLQRTQTVAETRVLAEHLERAGEFTDAIRWYLLSATRASELFHHKSAVQSFTAVLSLCRRVWGPDGVHRDAYIRAMRGSAETALHLGQLDDAAEQATTLLNIRPESIGDALHILARVAFRRGDLRTGRELFSRAAISYRALGQTEGLAHTKLEHARLEIADGRMQDAESLLRRSRAHFASLDNLKGEALALQALGQVAERTGLPDEAENYTRQALEQLEVLDEHVHAARCRQTLAELALTQGQPERALPLLDVAIEVLLSIGDRFGVSMITAAMGRAHEALGGYELARQLYNEALEGFRSLGDRGGETISTLALAHLDAVENHWAKAAQGLRAVLERDQQERIDDTNFIELLIDSAKRAITAYQPELGAALLQTAAFKLARTGTHTRLSDQVDEVEFLLHELQAGSASAMIELLSEEFEPGKRPLRQP